MWNKSFNAIKTIFALLFIISLSSCSGDDEPEEVSNIVPSNLQLESLQFEQHSINFNKSKTGPYQIAVDSDTASIRFTATNSSEDTNLRYQITNSNDATNLLPFESGNDIEFDLAEGFNLLRIYVFDNNSALHILYTVSIAKTSKSAQLNALRLFEPGEQAQSPLEPAFSPDVFSYTVDVEYESCSYNLNVIAGKPDNEILINNEEFSGFSYLGNLDIGANNLEFVVYSGAETIVPNDDPEAEIETSKVSEARYSLQINRPEPTEEQLQQNASLKNLSIEGHDFNFYCSESGTYNIAIRDDSESLSITAEAEVDGVEILYGEQVIENNLPVDIALEEDSNLLEITVNALDESTTKTYQIRLSRFTTNRVVVETAAELQYALQNAQPNDEIRVKPGEYEGLVGLETSGSDNAAFYSAMSGSRLQPIILTSDNLRREVVLKVDASSDSGEENIDVLQLAGDHWQVESISFRSGDTGVRLDKANNTVLVNLDVADVNLVGVDVGGSNNTLVDSSISVTQNDQQSDDNIPAALRVQGDSESNFVAANNNIYRNKLQGSIASPLVLLDIFSENTDLRQNEISSSASADTASFPLVQVKANNSTIRFNNFAPSSAINSALAFQQETITGAEGTEETNWGDSASIYQNTLNSAFSDLLFVQGNNAEGINAGENYLSWLKHNQDAADHSLVSYEGGNVQAQDGVSPIFRISPLAAEDTCLGLSPSETIEGLNFVELKPCGESDEFYWSFEYSSNQHVYIKNRSTEKGYLTGISTFVALCPSIATAESFTYLEDNLSGFSQQWAIYNDEDGYWFTNKFNSNFALTVGGETYGTDTPLTVCGFRADERQKFILKP